MSSSEIAVKNRTSPPIASTEDFSKLELGIQQVFS